VARVRTIAARNSFFIQLILFRAVKTIPVPMNLK
jgi:hypothetical protein